MFSMSKRSKQNSFSGPNPKHQKQSSEEEPKSVRFRRNNQVIEDSDFNFGTDDQRAEKQHYVNEKVCPGRTVRIDRPRELLIKCLVRDPV